MTRQSSIVFGLALMESLFAAEGYPQEIMAYIERRAICEHFRQEPWPEGVSLEERERREFLTGQLDRYCKGSDQVLRELKRKYKDNQPVMNRLEKFEATIEGHP